MIYVVTDAHATDHWDDRVRIRRPACCRSETERGRVVRGLVDGDPYLFWIRGPETGTEGFQRDPYARELGAHLFELPMPAAGAARISAGTMRTGGPRAPASSSSTSCTLACSGARIFRCCYGKFLDVIARFRTC